MQLSGLDSFWSGCPCISALPRPEGCDYLWEGVSLLHTEAEAWEVMQVYNAEKLNLF